MDDITILRHFFVRCGINTRDLNLLAEMVSTVDRLISLNEKDLRDLFWVDKTGAPKVLLDDKKIRKVLLETKAITSGLENAGQANKLRETILKEVCREELADFLSAIIPVDYATGISSSIGSIDTLVSLCLSHRLAPSLRTPKPILDKIEDIIGRVAQYPNPVAALKQIGRDRVGYSLVIANGFYSNRYVDTYDAFDAQTFISALYTPATLGDWDSQGPSILDATRRALRGQPLTSEMALLVQRAHGIFSQGLNPGERQVVFIFSNATKKVLIESVPTYLHEAIKSTHPFLLRPLFRSYPNAISYAVGGKVASSLETIWGTVGEDLYLALGQNLRAVRNGGIDVIQGRDAYDIKSGPAIMNNDQVSVLHLKQRIIQSDRRVPGLDTFRVALTYGKESDAFGTMVRDVQGGNILPARAAWEKLTGDPLAPERVYALAGLVADIGGIVDIIEAATAAASKSVAPKGISAMGGNPAIYDNDFNKIFENSFDPPTSRPQPSLDRLKAIDHLRDYVRNFL